MTAYTVCDDCGAIRAPWSLGHAPHCPEYKPPRSARLCPACGRPAGVRSIDLGPPAVVEFHCKHGCDVAWVETTEPDPEDTDDQEADDE